jgi:hypothetical protein
VVAPEPSSPSATGQPTLAAPAAASSNWAAATGSRPDSPQPTGSGAASADVRQAFDLPSQPAADLSSMPSVMARDDAAATPSEEEAAAAGDVRYLVVPERIARQADTSFTTPVAPEAQAPVAPAVADAGQAEPSAQQPSKATSAQTQQRQAQQAQAQQRQARSRQTQPAQQQRQGQPKQSQQENPLQPEAGGQKSDPRAWGGMFPNVSAGLDALGSWRGRVREAVVPQRPEPSQPAPQRR